MINSPSAGNFPVIRITNIQPILPASKSAARRAVKRPFKLPNAIARSESGISNAIILLSANTNTTIDTIDTVAEGPVNILLLLLLPKPKTYIYGLVVGKANTTFKQSTQKATF